MQKDFFDSIGHSRRFDRGPAASDVPRLTDIFRTGRHVSFVPRSDKRLWRDLGQMRAVIGAVTGRD